MLEKEGISVYAFCRCSLPGKYSYITVCFVIDPFKTRIGPVLLARAVRIFDKLTQNIECEDCILYHLLHQNVICLTLGTSVFCIVEFAATLLIDFIRRTDMQVVRERYYVL